MKHPRLKPDVRIALIYLLFGGIWILSTDTLLSFLVRDTANLTYLQIWKGWFFVASSALLIFFVLRRELTLRQAQEREIMKGEERFRTAFNDVLEGVQIIDYDWRYIYLNAAAEVHNNRPNSELLGKRYMDMWPGIEETHVFSVIKDCLEKRIPHRLDNRFVFPDGRVGWFSLSIEPVPEGVFIMSVDITKRARAEAKANQMKRLYATLSQVNQTIVRVKGRENLYQSICDLALNYGEFSLAWIGILDHSTGDLQPVAAKGADLDNWPLPVFNVREGRHKNVLTMTAIRTARVVTSDDVMEDARTQSLHELTQSYEFHSLAAVPFRSKSNIVGVVSLVSREIGLFQDEDEVRLLEEMGLDISFALDALDGEEERKRAEEALRAAENKYHSIFENSIEAITQTTPTGRYLTANPATARILGYGSDKELIASVNELDRQFYVQLGRREEFIRLMDEQGSISGFESEVYRKDGTKIWISENSRAVRDDDGKILYYEGTAVEITDRKQAEQKIQRQMNYLTALASIDRAIASTIDMRLSLDTLLTQAVSLLKVNAAAVLLVNTTLNTLNYAAALGFRTRVSEMTEVRLGDSHAGRVVLQRRLVQVSNLNLESERRLLARSVQDEKFVSYHGIPLIMKGRVIGVLEIYNRTDAQRDQEWLDFLETLAGQAAIAVDNAQSFTQMKESTSELLMAYEATIEGWSRAMDLRDEETEGHTQRVTELTLALAKIMGVKPQEIVHIRRGALLHDIGKLGVPDSILLKTGKLTDEEWTIMRRHPALAYEMLSPIAYLKPALDIPYCHHEKWDGTGYPRGLKGEEIPLVARIFAIVDVWDAVTSDRPYRAAWPKEKALDYICAESGKHFDPEVVEAFLEMLESM